ncbi:MAG: hypothetical protein R2706_17480 [Acidimicrobiales bacterium]
MKRIAVGAWLLGRMLVGLAFGLASLADQSRPFGERGRLAEGLVTWDGGWYKSIATLGYHADGEDLRFSPLFPALGRLVGFLFLGNTTLGLVVVANLAALGATWLAIVYADLVKPQASPEARRHQAIGVGLAVTLWPASFVMVFAYAESLLMVFALGAAIAARRGHWALAAAFGVLCGVTRPTGMAVALLLGAIALDDFRARSVRPTPPVALAVASPFVGFGLHLAVAQRVSGRWRDPIDIQSPLRGDFVDPFSRLGRGFVDLVADDTFGDGLHFPFAVAVIVMVYVVARELGWPEAVFSAAVVVVALGADNWNSLERYALSAFPLMLGIGMLLARHRRIGALVAAGSGVGFVALTVLSWSGHYVP